MATSVGINGFGRVGRSFMRPALGRDDLTVVAVNDITGTRTLAHLLAFDSTYGRLGEAVDYDDNALVVGGRRIRALARRDPGEIDWGELGADVVIEATGRFRARDDAALHLAGSLVRIFGWYDNEWAYSCRLADLAGLVGATLR